MQDLSKSRPVISLITQRTSACNTSSDMINDVLGDDTGTVDTSLVCSGIATKDETCSSDLLVVGADLFASPKKSVTQRFPNYGSRPTGGLWA